VIEPLPKLQWFINVNKKIPERGNKTLKELMLEPVEKKEINIMPERFERVYYNWVNNLRDWCISRQLWYGHRIPVWYKGDEIICDIEAPKGTGWEQDEDTLDTWFSSALWTFSTLGWPDEKNI
jgi:valyl-tRNA synthetase